jgi:hypothetical protein
MSTYRCSVAPAIPTSPSKHLINWHLGPPDAPSSDTNHKGYWCLDLTTNNIIVSQHVVFDETDFPFTVSPCLTKILDIFLQDNSWNAASMPAPLPEPPRVPVLPRRWRSNRASIATGPHRCWWSDHRPRWSDRASTAIGPIAAGGQTTRGTEDGCPTATPGCLIA